MAIKRRLLCASPLFFIKERSHVFWSFVDIQGADDCWPWLAATSGNGYGAFHYYDSDGVKKQIGAHRASYLLHIDADLPAVKVVQHSCDNPLCVNPAHLSEGTQADNLKDMTRKGRRRKCLNAEQVAAIRVALHCGETTYSVAKRYHVNTGTIHKIKTGVTYRGD